MFKALRVPISLLHQKIYDTSTRLDRRTPLVQEKKVVSPEVQKHADNITYMGYLRKFFYKKDASTLVCRICGEEAKTMDERVKHYAEACYMVGVKVLRMMMHDSQCAVCEQVFTDATQPHEAERDNIPVCCEGCMELWDISSPDAYKQELVVAKALEQRDDSIYHA
jgi:hypothetical protein